MNEQNGKTIIARCDYLIINYLIYNIMKIKKSFGLLAAVAVVAAAGWNYQQCKQSEELSELALANVEALAIGEKPSLYHLFPCPSSWGNECVFSQNTERPTCYGPTYCI